MELVLVSDLCGIACLSMQFSVWIDLVGTFVLPAAIVMTIYLIVSTALSTNPQWQSLGLLIAILILPALLIAITTLKLVYIGWMISECLQTMDIYHIICLLIVCIFF
jgi:chitin synthase